MRMKDFPYRRIVVVGSTSSGKSTVAARLAAQLGLDFIELDALHWEPNWTEASEGVLRERVEAATRVDGWVVAGNYHQVRDIIWPRAEVILWLDYSLPLIFGRLTWRTLKRGLTREELWNGNRESLLTHFKLWSPDSLFHWLFKTYWRRKREFPALFAEPAHAHLRVIRFGSPRETETWLGEP